MSHAKRIVETSESVADVVKGIKQTMADVMPEMTAGTDKWKTQARLLVLACYGVTPRPAWITRSTAHRKGFVDAACDALHCGRPTYD